MSSAKALVPRTPADLPAWISEFTERGLERRDVIAAFAQDTWAEAWDTDAGKRAIARILWGCAMFGLLPKDHYYLIPYKSKQGIRWEEQVNAFGRAVIAARTLDAQGNRLYHGYDEGDPVFDPFSNADADLVRVRVTVRTRDGGAYTGVGYKRISAYDRPGRDARVTAVLAAGTHGARRAFQIAGLTPADLDEPPERLRDGAPAHAALDAGVPPEDETPGEGAEADAVPAAQEERLL